MIPKYLGIQVGFPEKAADIRMTQYESGRRIPKADLANILSYVLQFLRLAKTSREI